MAITQDQKFTNNATTTVPSTISNVATSITVATGTGALFPVLAGAEFALCTIVNSISSDPGFGQLEIVRVTARSGDVFTITRAQDGTTAKSFPAGCVFELRPTAGGFDEIYSKMIAGDALQAPLASPVFTGNPTAPTPTAGDNDTSIATTAFVADAITTAVNAETGRLQAVQVFSVSGTYTPTAGTKFCIVEVIGGGGGGGGAAATAAGQFSIGGGGGAGGYAKGIITSPVSGAVTVGTGGAGNSGAAGAAGNASGFQGLIVANGGSGGSTAAAGTVPLAAGGTGGTVPALGNIVNSNGNPGEPAWASTASIQGVTGGGGSGFYGGAGQSFASGNIAGTAGAGIGSGGSGAFNLASQSARSGGGGSNGRVIVWDYL